MNSLTFKDKGIRISTLKGFAESKPSNEEDLKRRQIGSEGSRNLLSFDRFPVR